MSIGWLELAVKSTSKLRNPWS